MTQGPARSSRTHYSRAPLERTMTSGGGPSVRSPIPGRSRASRAPREPPTRRTTAVVPGLAAPRRPAASARYFAGPPWPPHRNQTPGRRPLPAPSTMAPFLALPGTFRGPSGGPCRGATTTFATDAPERLSWSEARGSALGCKVRRQVHGVRRGGGRNPSRRHGRCGVRWNCPDRS